MESLGGLGLEKLKPSVDVAEHSLEMQLPILRYALDRRAEAGLEECPMIIPLVVSDPSEADIIHLASIFQAILNDESSMLIISSDFCHWGRSFQYNPSLDSFIPHNETESCPMHKRIELMDSTGLKAIEAGRHNFEQYLSETGNTICGRDPIRIALELCKMGSLQTGKWNWLHYEQSDQIVFQQSTASQVSYVAGVFRV